MHVGWVDELSAGIGRTPWSNGCLFTLTCLLTDQGTGVDPVFPLRCTYVSADHVDDVIYAAYQHIKLLQTSGVQPWIFEEVL